MKEFLRASCCHISIYALQEQDSSVGSRKGETNADHLLIKEIKYLEKTKRFIAAYTFSSREELH